MPKDIKRQFYAIEQNGIAIIIINITRTHLICSFLHTFCPYVWMLSQRLPQNILIYIWSPEIYGRYYQWKSLALCCVMDTHWINQCEFHDCAWTLVLFTDAIDFTMIHNFLWILLHEVIILLSHFCVSCVFWEFW